MLKLRTSGKEINPHSGVSFCIDVIEEAGIPTLLTKTLGARGRRSKYQYSDAILSIIYGIVCGATRLSDLKGLKKKLDDPNLNIPSPDIISDIVRLELSEENEIITSDSDNSYGFNMNKKLNGLMLDTALHLDLLDTEESYTLDYDNTVLFCDKHGKFCNWTYKKSRGYTPGVSWIGQIPVYIEGRAGNAPPKFKLMETVSRNFDLMDERGIQIGRFRSDAAGYQKSVVDFMEDRGIDFFIRANHSKAMWEKINQVEEWKRVRIGFVEFDVAGFQFKPFGGDKEYRIMVSRLPNETGENHSKTGEPFVYRCVITNNIRMSDAEVLKFYNDRGAIEKNYDMMGNDFLWKNLPFSYMNENQTFMLITGIGAILYRFLIDIFAARVDFVNETDRMKAFRLNFISLAGEWIEENGEMVLLIHDMSRHYSMIGEYAKAG